MYFMEQEEMNNMFINIGVNNGSEKGTERTLGLKMHKCRDRKHCRMKCPQNAGSLYFNYKNFHWMNLLGVAVANCCFTLIDVGAHGREDDNSVSINSSFGKTFRSGDLNVPPIRNILGTSISIPLYFVGDEAFPLKPRT